MTDIPTEWDSMALDARILEAIKDLKWNAPTAVQGACIPLALKGKDVSIQSRTGTGKTGAFVIPIIQRIVAQREQKAVKKRAIGPVALIIVPSLELCEQAVEVIMFLVKYVKPRIVVENLASGSTPTTARILSAHILVSTAALLARLSRTSGLTVEHFQHLRYLVIDEADMLVSMAEISLRTIQSLLPNSLQVILSSATLNEGVASIKGQLLHNPTNIVLTTEAVNSTEKTYTNGPIVESRIILKDLQRKLLRQYYLVATDECHRHTLLFALYRMALIKGKTLIFVEEDEDTYRLQSFLEQLGVATLVYDAALPVNVRLDTLRKFQIGSKVSTLVCTDSTLESAEKLQMSLDGVGDDENAAASEVEPRTRRKRRQRSAGSRLGNGEASADIPSALHRGIDFAHVRNVILFDGVNALSPISLLRYTHRIGRAARGGEEGLSITFFTVPQAKKYIHPLRDYCKSKGSNVEPFRQIQRSEAAKLQYRVDSVLANTTRTSTRKLRVATVAAELSRSSYLANHLCQKDTEALQRVVNRCAKKVKIERDLLAVPDYMALSSVDEVSDYTKRVRADQTRATIFKKAIRKRNVDPLKSVAIKIQSNKKHE
ncbi:unnamed protein product [Phytomonas sp. Hart1]|nr:unnamed protein product [Phytomonas sp. Hart1]|eukprot:CCW66090.1 unnamed protein product [Phytomonas sp. isolate Hart1]